MINDKNIYLSDKYNKKGNLINIDELYIFQPIELKDKFTFMPDNIDASSFPPIAKIYPIIIYFIDLDFPYERLYIRGVLFFIDILIASITSLNI